MYTQFIRRTGAPVEHHVTIKTEHRGSTAGIGPFNYNSRRSAAGGSILLVHRATPYNI